MPDTLLLVDDDSGILRTLGDYFEREGYEVRREPSGAGGIDAFERERADVVILDLHLPDMSGLDVLERIRAKGASVILLTGEADIETAVRAMQLGAENFLTKPIDLTHLAAATARVAEKVRLWRQNELLRARERIMPAGDGARATGAGRDALGVSPRMRELGRQVELLAASERSTVLLTGESGSGKGWVARLIHQLSRRGKAGAPFVDVNCNDAPVRLVDSELFGHEQGAFPEAQERRRGLFELAHEGSIFLDEIGELPLELQPKLLKVLETKTFRRLGGTDEITVDVRVIAATKRDLTADVAAGRFREDLYFRMSILPLALPPLRERSREDRLALVTRLIAALRLELPGSPGTCSAEALDRLLSAPWAGNVREMRNVLERAMILAQGAPAIGIEHLPADIHKGAGAADRRHVPQTLSEVERHHIERTLRAHGGNRTRAAQELAISRATLINKIKAYGLDI
ncbi:MAG TPA: sigma-54 dependent transcriptional regulator [Gemmatimonadales bacterium]|nr:sigma-54 dependent transcriptional regulator [Gemmatimonadales bacterium]